MINALTVDVEEYFHPSEVQAHVDDSAWLTLPSRVDYQVDIVLNMLRERGVSATFFVLGWIAEHHPGVIDRIAREGHEIGCHSYSHKLVYELTPAEFRADTVRALQAIQDACGRRCTAYRAPSYSITEQSLWALDILAECGIQYDSSIYPIRHDRYGVPSFSRHPKTIQTASGPIHEIPVGTAKLRNGAIAPIGGGGYLRLLPYRYTAAGIRQVNGSEQMPVCIYFHPWEIDRDQPRLASGLISRLRTYTGLASMPRKIDRLLQDFSFSTVSAVYGNTNEPAAEFRRMAAQPR
jgi:polysaccharide deacetylase family protein (PEP-CTERM system associated)